MKPKTGCVWIFTPQSPVTLCWLVNRWWWCWWFWEQGGVSWLPIICLLRLEAPKDINTSTGTGLKRQGARVSCDRSAVLVRVHPSWLQVELNFCLFVKMNRTASGCRRYFPRKLLLSHLLIARRLILFFFSPKQKHIFPVWLCLSHSVSETMLSCCSAPQAMTV